MNPEEDPIGNDRRKSRQSRRLPPDAACALCGETDPTALLNRPASALPPTLLEAHHALGEANASDVIVVLCRNCHAKATEAQRDVEALPPGRAPSCFERLAFALRSLGSFFGLLAQWCHLMAAQLAQAVAALDKDQPDWRTLPGMP